MITISSKLTFHIEHASSLKDKRMVARSLIDKTRHKFNAAVAEVDTQEAHKTLTIGVAVISGENAHARDMMDEIIYFMENNTDADLVMVEEVIDSAEDFD